MSVVIVSIFVVLFVAFFAAMLIYGYGEGIAKIQEKEHSALRVWIFRNIALRVRRTTLGNAQLEYSVFGMPFTILNDGTQRLLSEEQAILSMNNYKTAIERWVASDDREKTLAAWGGMNQPLHRTTDWPGP